MRRTYLKRKSKRNVEENHGIGVEPGEILQVSSRNTNKVFSQIDQRIYGQLLNKLGKECQSRILSKQNSVYGGNSSQSETDNVSRVKSFKFNRDQIENTMSMLTQTMDNDDGTSTHRNININRTETLDMPKASKNESFITNEQQNKQELSPKIIHSHDRPSD